MENNSDSTNINLADMSIVNTVSDEADMVEDVKFKSTVLENVRRLIESKTRFESDEIQSVSESENLQLYEIFVRHALDATPITQNITGHFLRDAKDNNTSNPIDDASKEVESQLRTASNKLGYELAKSTTKYNQIDPGILLIHSHKHWYLHTCSTCSGAGENVCLVCHGWRVVRCYECSGSRKIRCNGYGCSYGRVSCTQCGGQGRISHQVAYQVPYSVSINGSYQTQYRTEYRTEYKYCHSCSNGQVICSKCSGTAQIDCPLCCATGELICSNCAGSGKVTCQPCLGSGEVGEASWVDVHVKQEYTRSVPDGTPQDVREIIEKEGLHGLPSISEKLIFSKAIQDSQDSITAAYSGEFRVVRQNVICHDETAHLVAYGSDLRWWTLDGVIQRLLQDDLNALSNTIVESENEGIFSPRIDHILEKLKHVAASEINVDIVEASLSDQDLTQHRGAVSDEFANCVKHSIQAALRRVYIRSAMRLVWVTSLVGVTFGMLVWAFEGAIWGAIAAIVVLLFSYMLHRRSVQTLLTKILISPEYAKRTMLMAAKVHAVRDSVFLLSMPTVLIALAMVLGLPPAPLAVKELYRTDPSIASDLTTNPSELLNKAPSKLVGTTPSQTEKLEEDDPAEVTLPL